jgi:hypothetical protein
VQLELIGAVSVSSVPLKIFGQIDDFNGTEGALLDTDTTTNAKGLAEPIQYELETDDPTL